MICPLALFEPLFGARGTVASWESAPPLTGKCEVVGSRVDIRPLSRRLLRRNAGAVLEVVPEASI
jgi:hypothetical protein